MYRSLNSAERYHPRYKITKLKGYAFPLVELYLCLSFPVCLFQAWPTMLDDFVSWKKSKMPEAQPQNGDDKASEHD